MPIVLPKDKRFLTGFRFRELIPFEMNTLSLPTILSAVFRLVVLEGSDSSRGKSEDIGSIERSIRELVGHPRLVGFDSVQGRRVAHRIVESSLIRAIKIQRTKQVQIDALVPYTIASFKAGFPTNKSGYRQVDRFLFELLLAQRGGDRRAVRTFIEQTFGEGVEVRGAPIPSAVRRPGDLPDVDVMTELSLAYADGFAAIVPKRTENPYVPARPLPAFQDAFGRDLYRFWTTYAARHPRTLLVDQTVTLLAFELTLMSLKLFHAVPQLANGTGALPAAMASDDIPSPPEVYVDWIGDARHVSRSIAQACVRRDIAQVEPFTRAVFGLRYLNEVINDIRRDRTFRTIVDQQLGAVLEGDTPGYMRSLLGLLENPELNAEIRWGARSHREAIIVANRSGDDDDETAPASDADRLVEAMDEVGMSPVEQVQELLYQAQAVKSQQNTFGWLREVGGVGMSYGLISGVSNRRTWSYSPGNELLTVLVQLCAVDYTGWNPAKGAEPRAFGLKYFLEWLELRFGIIVDRPPVDLGFDGPEYVTAARDNLQALLRRLRQMGMFEDQSDDFTVQQITPPFAEVAESADRS